MICGLSGGVDSSVAAVLLHEAIGDQLTCVFVDHGLLRAGEAEQVVTLFRDAYNIPLVHVQAQDIFLKELAGVTDPELKRKTHRPAVHRMCSRPKRRRSAMRASSPRARSIRT